MVATSGSKLISDDAIGTLKEYLFPMAAVLTPNIPETEVLSGMEVKSAEDMIAAATNEALRQVESESAAVMSKLTGGLGGLGGGLPF